MIAGRTAGNSIKGGNLMDINWDVVKGKWKQMRGEAKSQWGDITDDEWDQIGGEREKLVGKLQERYGYEKAEAERHADERIGEWNARY
jgi:uncharacterized protein YjbJ (UPF0337 family)